MASDRSRALWQKGIWLSDAWRDFADQEQLTLLDTPMQFDAAKKAISGKTTVPEFIAGTIDSIAAFYAPYREKRQLEAALKEQLLETLYNADLIATAYREAPTTSDSPVSLSADDFANAKADWLDSRLFLNGKTFGRVRITDPHANNLEELPKPIRGRIGSRIAIDDAIDRLIVKGIDFQAIRRTEGCKLICQELGIVPKDGDGFSNINLSKRIVSKCGIKARIR